MKMNILKYLSVFFSYFIVDASYQALFGIKFAQKAQEAAGIKDIYAEGLQNPILMLIWFIIMTIGIVKLAVEPAVKEKNIKGEARYGKQKKKIEKGTKKERQISTYIYIKLN